MKKLIMKLKRLFGYQNKPNQRDIKPINRNTSVREIIIVEGDSAYNDIQKSKNKQSEV